MPVPKDEFTSRRPLAAGFVMRVVTGSTGAGVARFGARASGTWQTQGEPDSCRGTRVRGRYGRGKYWIIPVMVDGLNGSANGRFGFPRRSRLKT